MPSINAGVRVIFLLNERQLIRIYTHSLTHTQPRDYIMGIWSAKKELIDIERT